MPLLKLGGQSVKYVTHYKYLGIVLLLILSFQMTKTFRDNCDIYIVQQTSCELFPDIQTQQKMYFFIPSVRPCMHYHNYDVISGSHAYRDCVRPTIFGAGLYNLPWEASVSSHQVQYNTPAFEALLRKNVHLFLEQCRQSNNVWLHALMQSDCLYSSLFFEHYNRILLCH